MTSLLESNAATYSAPSASVNETSIRVIEYEGPQASISLLQNKNISSAMIDDVRHGRAVPTEGSNPLFRFNGIFLLRQPQKFLDCHQPVVAELEPVLGDFPSVNMRIVRGEDRQTVIQEPSIDKRNIIPSSEVGKPNVGVKQAPADILQEPFLCADEVVIPCPVIENAQHIWLTRPDLFESNTQDDTKVSV